VAAYESGIVRPRWAT